MFRYRASASTSTGGFRRRAIGCAGPVGPIPRGWDVVSEHHGEWQAQGDDIPGRGHRVSWGQADVPTKAQGLAWLGAIATHCTESVRKRRERACRDAKRFVDRAPVEGYPSMMKSFYCGGDRYPNARIDLEIYGLAFRDPGADHG